MIGLSGVGAKKGATRASTYDMVQWCIPALIAFARVKRLARSALSKASKAAAANDC